MSALAWLVVSVAAASVSPSERVADEATCRRIVAERNAGWAASRVGDHPPWLCVRVVVPAEQPCYRFSDEGQRERHVAVPPSPPSIPIREPSGLALLGAGLAGLAVTRHRGVTTIRSRVLARLGRIASLVARRPDGDQPRGNEGNAAVAGKHRAAKAVTRAAALVLGAAMLLGAGAAFAQGVMQEQAPGVPYRNTPLLERNQTHPTCNVDDWWSYSSACCCTHGWCAAIPGERVKEEAGGYRVTLFPGDHPQIRVATSWWVASRFTALSPDGRFHFCGGSWPGTAPARCLLAPPGGA